MLKFKKWPFQKLGPHKTNTFKDQIDRLITFSRKVSLFVALGPTYHYTYGWWRLNRWLNPRLARFTHDDDDRAFFNQLNFEMPELDAVKQAVINQDYQAAKASLNAYFQTRTTPHFLFEPGDIDQNVAFVEAHQKEATIRAANEICQNIFCFRRAEPVKFEDEIDWDYRPEGNKDWTWDLNRHSYFETLGRAYWYTRDDGYALKFKTLLLDWLAKNPVSVNHPNWNSVFEVAFRVNTWLWAFYFFRSANGVDQETGLALLRGLLAHGQYLAANLELHVRNNHLLLEAKALAMLGLLFPEFKAAEQWRRQGLKLLYREIEAQVCADGVHGERATHYHRVITGELLELLVLLENNGISIPSNILEIFGRMVEFELWITKPNSLIPLLGDSALEDTHLRFSAAGSGPVFLGRSDLKSAAPALDEASIWLLGPERVGQYQQLPASLFSLKSRAYLEGGYFIMRTGQKPKASYLVFDCGPFGFQLEPHHGHADALSFELYALGQTLLVDPGVYSTRLGQNWRQFFRGSRAHNTVVVDNQDQSLLLDSRRVYRQARTTLHQWISNDQFDFVDGSHDGYERLVKPVTHRRQIFFVKPDYWIVIDCLTGQGSHRFDSYFHLMPGLDAQLDSSSGALWAQDGAKSGLAIIPLMTGNLQADLIAGATNPIQGWVSLFSGEKVPASALRYRREGPAPVQFCSVLYPCPSGDVPAITNLGPNVKVETRSNPERIISLTALCIESGQYTDRLIIDRGPAGTHKVLAECETDAQLLYLRQRKSDNKLVKAVMRGGRLLLWHGQPLSDQSSDLAGDFIFDSGAFEKDIR
jgi:hypothetical protein